MKVKTHLHLRKINFTPRTGSLLLIIIDGIGLGKPDETNGVYLAKTPTLDKLFKSKLFTTLCAHGEAVGLPSDKDMGNSEVGHNTLGAGRIFPQGPKLVDQALKTGRVFSTNLWKKLISRVKQNETTLHFIGLHSDGNVHSNISHLYIMLRQAAKEGVKKVRVHILLDGRDVPPRSALTYIKRTEKVLAEINQLGLDYKIASGGGRMVTTMDRYNANWQIVKNGWDAHVLGKARAFESATQAVKTYYQEYPKLSDQYLPPFVIVDEKKNPIGKIKDGDSVIFFNFRGDRAIEISRVFEEKDFKEFDREFWPDVLYAGMIEYDGDLHIPKNYLVEPLKIDRTVSEYLCAQNIRMFALSETQKFGHVTYFWNGNRSGYLCPELEDYIEIPSDKIRFDLKPEMKSKQITEKTIELLKTGKYQFGRINFPNGDMVGHTGNEKAIIKAVEAVDKSVGELLKVIQKLKGIAIVLADHGNAEQMFEYINHKKVPCTSHTLNPVPFVIFDPQYKEEYVLAKLKKRGLSNVAATILNLLGFEKPSDYDPSLIEFKFS